ncbi:hypothetical protein Droror1_Dr00007277 [Drosera rotundifolia]
MLDECGIEGNKGLVCEGIWGVRDDWDLGVGFVGWCLGGVRGGVGVVELGMNRKALMGLWMSKAFGNVLYLLGGEVRNGICIEQFGVWSRGVRFVSFGIVGFSLSFVVVAGHEFLC